MAYNLRTGLTGSGDIDINVSLDNLDAANITSGQFGDARICGAASPGSPSCSLVGGTAAVK